jgi:hypothetical protein
MDNSQATVASVTPEEAMATGYRIECMSCGVVLRDGPLLRLSDGSVSASHGACPTCLVRLKAEVREIQQRHFAGPCIRCGHEGGTWKRRRLAPDGCLETTCPKCGKRHTFNGKGETLDIVADKR